jgi:cardiolipin synthase
VGIVLLRPGAHCDQPASQVASQAQYGRLLEAGVKVWEYQPTMFNAKVITLDGQVAVMGPVNFDSRSLTYDEEVMVVVVDPEVVGALDAQFDADLGRAEEVRPASWEQRHRRQRAMEGVVGYLARRV